MTTNLLTTPTLDLSALDWLEYRAGCDRYALPRVDGEDGESLWVCALCASPADPDMGGCPDCSPENFYDWESETETETEECAA